jgi:cell wall assembly regulator SMI1
MTVRESWDVIHDWLRAHHPKMLRLLRKPAKPAALAKLEKHLGRTLPDSFKESYLIHDGSDDLAGILVGLPLMPLAEVGRTWESWAEIADDGDTVEDLSEDCSSSPKGAVKELYANRGWVPFAGDAMNHVALDFDPGPKGKVGQVINCGRDDEVRHVIADDFEGFLAFVARLFTAGVVALNEEESPDDPRWLGVKGRKKDLLTGLADLLAAHGRRPGKRQPRR